MALFIAHAAITKTMTYIQKLRTKSSEAADFMGVAAMFENIWRIYAVREELISFQGCKSAIARKI